ncbi:MAG: NADH-quinone oxidoreductase subunit L [Elusimicrobia bacterium]|nr:NADH-quinone oxidoreductase subunit L [Elusimicrobiota bacterium]
MLEYIYILPLMGFAAAGLIIAFGRHLPLKGASLAILVSSWAFIHSSGFTVGQYKISMGVYVDSLTLSMLIVVAAVSLMIQIYSVGYMKGDKRFKRYYAYLCLFTASMTTLTITDNMMVFFMGWELVGVCSYLLISFWFEKPEAAYAGKKAFITTKLGDLGFLIGLLLLFSVMDTFKLSEIFSRAQAGFLSIHAATLICILLFAGAIGKSAQMPLFIWLPDAMEGPTPVSALIHAATMVAAGVYMVARLYNLYLLSPLAMEIVAWIGAMTAFLAATMALVAYDIKRVLAFSTISQLGYMMLGLGVGGYYAGMFHLTTHAYFKALLFLGSGSVIHALHTNDLREMGGLMKKMPVTYMTFMAGSLALAGIWPFAGFYSKDEILVWALSHNTWIYLIAAVSAMLTAFYMTRLIVMAFHGKPRNQSKYHHSHESPLVMTLPLVFLAVLALISGWGLNSGRLFEKVLNATVPFLPEMRIHVSHMKIALASTGLALLSIFAGVYLYAVKPEIPEKLKANLSSLFSMLDKRYGFDAFFLGLVKVSDFLGRILSRLDFDFIDQIAIDGWAYLTYKLSAIKAWFDDNIVDGAVDGTGYLTAFCGRIVRLAQTGFVQNYLLFIAAAASFFALIVFYH